MRKLFLTGHLPYSVAVALCVAAYLLGHGMQKPVSGAKQDCGVAIAEKGAVVLEAVLDRPTMSKTQMVESVTAPIQTVLRHYQEQGYTVIDTSRNDQGDMTVAALPPGAIDITNELRKAVKLPAQQAPGAQGANPASATGHE